MSAQQNESERDRSRRSVYLAWNRPGILYHSKIDTWIQDGRPRNEEEILSVLKLLAFREKWGCCPRFFRYKIESKIGMLKIFYAVG